MASPSMSPPVTGHTPPFTVPYRLHSAQPGRRPESIPPGYGLVEDDAAVDGFWLAVGAGVCVGDGVGVGDEDPAEEGGAEEGGAEDGGAEEGGAEDGGAEDGGVDDGDGWAWPGGGDGPVTASTTRVAPKNAAFQMCAILTTSPLFGASIMKSPPTY